MEWISVEDRLPDDGSKPAFYHCIIVKENRVVMEAMFNSKTQSFMRLDFNRLKHEVTHWMPLPEPPAITVKK